VIRKPRITEYPDLKTQVMSWSY